VRTLIRDLERAGPEPVGAPVRGVAMLARDVGDLVSTQQGPLATRRRRANAIRLARNALSVATAVHGVVEDRPGAERAWPLNVAAVAQRLGGAPQDTADLTACVRALGGVAALALQLPVLPDDQWQAEMMAFADEGLLDELREACLGLAAAALRVADDES
jgi:hypothetical protein